MFARLKRLFNFALRLGCKKKGLEPEEVFTPGGIPLHTYVPRDQYKLESRLITELKGNKLIIVTGLTKSGKSVLVSRTMGAPHIEIDGGSIETAVDFWDQMALKLNTFNIAVLTHSKQKTAKAGISMGCTAFGFKTDVELAQAITTVMQTSREISNKSAVLNVLNSVRVPVVIDDFHYINREIQLDIIRALKNPVLRGLPVVLIAIPHRKFDPIRVEREIIGRTAIIEIPAWQGDELKQIPLRGFPLLGMKACDEVMDDFAAQSFGSPHLMQEFCLKYCASQAIGNEFYYDIAKHTCRVIFDKLLRGPRQRSDRKIYILRTGEKADIYGVMLYALSILRPGLQSYEYEQIRAAVKESIKGDTPASNQISNTLKLMSQISKDDESSTPVIDWIDERVLHITDPYFAFFLRWGLQGGLYAK